MSTSLTPIDLTGAIVGTQVTLDFNQFVKFNPARMQQKAHLGLFNESGCGLQCVMQASNDSQYLPAGGWTTFEIESNDSNMLATVTYTLPNPPVSQLNAVYYAPGEEIPNSYTLGNSPIGIGGTVNTSSVQTLSNEGNAANTLVEDIGDVAFAQLFTLYTDGHCLWAVDQSGVKHQVIKIQTAGNALQLGQAGDTSEALGAFQIDQNAAIRATLNAAISLVLGISADVNRGLVIFGHSATQSGNLLALQTSVFANVFTVGPTGNTAINGTLSAVGSSSLDNGAITTDGSGNITTTGIVTTNTLQDTSGDNVISVTGTGATQNTRLQSGNQINLQTPGGSTVCIIDSAGIHLNAGQLILTDGAMKHISAASTACGAATTITHGLGTTPRIVTGTPDFAVSGSATVGVGSVGATTFIGDIGAGTNLMWWAVHE